MGGRHHVAGDLDRAAGVAAGQTVFQGDLTQNAGLSEVFDHHGLGRGLAQRGRLARDVDHAGVALLVDYGYARRDYYSPDRSAGTLMCHYRHRSNSEPLYLPGMQDITAHVDFTAVAEAADTAGLAVSVYTSQAQFLLGCGIEQLLQERAERQDADWFGMVEGFKQLVLPTGMGERFRVMALTRAVRAMPAGFDQDLRFTL